MVGNTLSPGQMIGNVAAFSMPISFAVLILVVRKYQNIDMVPSQFIAGIFALIIGYLMSGKIIISYHDIFLGFLAGFFQLGLVLFYNNRGTKNTFSYGGIIMLTEAVFGPLWAWLFINEQPPNVVLSGGKIVIIAVLLQFLHQYKLSK